MNNPTDELESLLLELSERTERGEIRWSAASSNQYFWRKNISPDEAQQISIQRSEPSIDFSSILLSAAKDRTEYLLEMISFPMSKNALLAVQATKKTLLSISTKERQSLRDVLARLFSVAESSVDKVAVNALRNFLHN